MSDTIRFTLLTFILLIGMQGIKSCTPGTVAEPPVLHDDLSPGDSLKWMEIVAKVDGAGTKGDLVAERKALDEAALFCRENNYPIYLFQVYNIYSQRLHSFGEIESGDAYLDSAAWVIDYYDLPQFKAQLNLAYASMPRNVRSDSSLYYFKLALADTANLLDVYKKLLYANLSRTYISKAFYKEGKFYAEKALALNHLEDFDNRLLNEIHFYQYIYLCDMGLKDTAAAFTMLSKAYRIMMDSLGGKGDESIYRSMGEYYLDRQRFDSALFYFEGYEKRIAETRTDQMHIIPDILKAKVYAKKKDFVKAEELLTRIEKAGDPTSDLIGYAKFDYYHTRYEVNKHKGNLKLALSSLEAARELENQQHREEKSLQLAALEESLTQARAEKTIAEKEQKINEQKGYTTLSGVATVLIAFIGFLLYRNQRRKKLLETQRLKTLEQQVQIEKAALKFEAEDQERKRISKEIHDDIGPALTTLSIAANMIHTEENDRNSQVVSLIRQHTQAISQQINEIIWSLNSNNDNLQSLVSHIRKFAGNFLHTAGMQLSFESDLDGQNQQVEGYKRRNIYHSVKEVLNNAVKYSKASLINVKMAKEENDFKIFIQDNGSGLPENIVFGNGLGNIRENIRKMKGDIAWENDNGFLVRMSIPLTEV